MGNAESEAAIGSTLLEFAASRVASGQAELAHHIKLQLSASGHPAASRLDYAGEEPFLNPSLFAFFSDPDPEMTLDQILDVDLFAERFIEGTRIGYSTHPNPLSDWFLKKGRSGTVGGEAIQGDDYAAEIAKALEIIRRIDRPLYRCLESVTRQIVTFCGTGSDSFASLQAHGAVFLKTPSDADEVFFIEDLAHQGGHLIFNAITLDRGEFFNTDPNTPLGRLTGETDDPRSLYVALHGVFTECLMATSLLGSLRLDVFGDRQIHELRGRLSFTMKRLQLDLRSIRELEVFTDLGKALTTSFEDVFDEVFASGKAEIVACDVSNQPYSFSYDRFVALNSEIG